jgi:nitrite reductase/ring-hydroxylating ferredoxin subunit
MQQEKEYIWLKVADTKDQFLATKNGITEIPAADRNICIINHNETLYACSTKCPHAGGKLADGYIDALGNIVCPLHSYKYNVQTGRNVSGEGYFLKTFPVAVRQDGVYVRIEQNNLVNGVK